MGSPGGFDQGWIVMQLAAIADQQTQADMVIDQVIVSGGAQGGQFVIIQILQQPVDGAGDRLRDGYAVHIPIHAEGATSIITGPSFH